MTIFNFVTQDELDNLDEDPRMAFMQLVNHAQRNLSEQTSRFDPDNQNEWHKKSELEKSFMNVIVAAGKSYDIEPFSTMEIPKQENFGNGDYEQFKSDLDHYITQLVLSNSQKARGNSVEMLPQAKDQIRSYLRALRDCVEKSGIPKDKKSALLDRLGDFERELEKRRVNFLSLSLLAIAIVGAPGATWDSVELAQKLITNITRVFAEAKQTEEQTRRVGPQAAPKALSPPRSAEPTKQGDLDDDIPF